MFPQRLFNISWICVFSEYMTFAWHLHDMSVDFTHQLPKSSLSSSPPPESDPIDGCCPRNPMKERFLHACLGAEGYQKKNMARKRNIGRSKGDRIIYVYDYDICMCVHISYLYIVCIYSVYIYVHVVHVWCVCIYIHLQIVQLHYYANIVSCLTVDWWEPGVYYSQTLIPIFGELCLELIFTAELANWCFGMLFGKLL